MIWQEITGPISDTDPLVQGKKKKGIPNENKVLCKGKTQSVCIAHFEV